jgi:hypothetical protein
MVAGMPDLVTALATVYVGGLLVGLLTVDESFPGRLVVAAAWPLGPIAFLGVVTVLVLALPIALPRAALALALLMGFAGWALYYAM